MEPTKGIAEALVVIRRHLHAFEGTAEFQLRQSRFLFKDPVYKASLLSEIGIGIGIGLAREMALCCRTAMQEIRANIPFGAAHPARRETELLYISWRRHRKQQQPSEQPPDKNSRLE